MILSVFNTHVIDYVNMTLLLKDILVSETLNLFLIVSLKEKATGLRYQNIFQ